MLPDSYFWNDAEVANQIRIMDRKIGLAYLTGDITRLSADPLTNAEAMFKLNQFELGTGDMKMVD